LGYLNPWVEIFATSVRIFKTMNYCRPPEVKWLLVRLLNNMTQRCALLFVLLLPEYRIQELAKL